MSELSRGDVIVLSPAERGQPALVLSRQDLRPALGRRVGMLATGAVASLVHTAGLASHGVAATQVLSGNWVQLTQESAAKLAELGASLDGSGVPMAILREGNGQFDHVMRFESLGAAPVAATSLIGGLAVQLSLMRIERALEDLRERVDVLVDASRIEVEADLAAALSVMERIERRVADRGVVDDGDWASLAAIEAPIKAAYHQTIRWLDPLRQFLNHGAGALVTEVRALRTNLGIRDVGFWLRMYAYGELAMKRWDALYLLREAVVAPDRVGGEGKLLLEQARGRHAQLLSLHDQIAGYLDADGAGTGLFDGLRLLSKSRLLHLRVELATAVNAYGAALDQIEVAVPEYAVDQLRDRQGPLLDLEAVQSSAARTAQSAIGAGASAAQDVGRWIGGNATSVWRRARPDN